MEMEKEYLTSVDITQELLDSIGRILDWYSTGFVGKGKYEPELRGSGTLINIDENYGVLTAYHVIEHLKKTSEFGLILSHDEHSYLLRTEYVHFQEIAKPIRQSEGPDLGVILLPKTLISTLKAKKTFYNVSLRREKVLKSLMNVSQGIWVLSGYVDELTTDEEPKGAFNIVKRFCFLCGLAVLEKSYTSGDYDFLELSVRYREDVALPITFGGISGGGIWQVPMRRSRNGDIEPYCPILAGVAFYETGIQSNLRYIRCHGLRSIYENVYIKIVSQRKLV